MDGALEALAGDIERGAHCPVLSLLLRSGATVQGQPTPSRDFMERQRGPYEHAWSSWERSRPRKEQRAAPINVAMVADANLQPLQRAISADERSVLTLADVRVTVPAGPVLALPACRVSLEAVDAWWFAGAEVAPERATWSFGVGVISPVE